MFDLSKNIQSEARIETRIIPADRLTPIKILEDMKGKVLLETAYAETGKGKYSIILLKEAFTIYKKDNRYYLINPDGKKYLIKAGKKGFLDIIKEFRERAPKNENLYEFPIPLGGIGYLGYNFFEEIEDIKFRLNDDRGLYDSAFIFGRNFLIYDHLHDQALLISAFYRGEIEEIDLKKELDNIEKEIKEIATKESDYFRYIQKKSIIKSPNDRESFIEKVKFLKEEIYKGNLLQCVISRRIEIETNLKPIEAYRNLRMHNPSPYIFYFDFNKFQLFGASPEVMVKVNNNKITVRPIAGTRPRGKTMAEDKALENELKNDEKELAEHLMLVDLGRNDVGRVSIGGSVKVKEEMVVEKYSNVMHLVSEVEGILDPEKKVEDVIKATFPAGTVSGAPKIQAIKTLDKIEDYARGPYAGLVGYFDINGNFDSCIIIRSVICKGKTMWLQAGAGIVYDSVPEKEFDETNNKMRALMIALGFKDF